MDIKDLLKKHILTILAVISVISLALPFITIKSSAEIMGNSAATEVVMNGFACMKKSFFTFLLFAGPVVVAAMNYIKPLEKYKGILAVAVPVICIISFIIVFFQVKGGSAAASSAALNTKISAGMSIGAILALLSYIGTAVAGAVLYHNFRFDRASMERFKNDGMYMARNFSEKMSDTVHNVASSASAAVSSASAAVSSVKSENAGDTSSHASAPSSYVTQKASAKPVKLNMSRTDEILALIERLHKMKDDGILTEEEFSEKKKKLLEEI